MNITVFPSRLSGAYTAPPSKSAAHRAVIAAALARGRSVIHNVDLSSDIAATVGACRALGCFVSIEPSGRYNTLYIDGGMGIAGEACIDCAESGSTLRFMIPVACALEGNKTFSGRGRLPHRPIDEYIKIFDAQGVAYDKPEDKNLPLTVSGTLRGGGYTIDGGVSSQYITGLLLALPLLKEDSSVTVTGDFESKGYVDMTLDALRKFGVDIQQRGNAYIIEGNQVYKPQTISVEGDYSQAAFFMAGAALAGDVTITGLDSCSLQPDRAIVEILRRMGADIRRQENGLRITAAQLHGTDVDVSQCPDLVPPIAAAAAGAQGATCITGAARLRIKESDRLRALSVNLNKLGIRTEEREDALIIHGGEICGGEADSFGDHRIAMASAISALRSGRGVTINGAECVAKSYPAFFEDLKTLGGSV